MKEKRPQGRPSGYKPEYDQMLADHMREGFSFESFAGVIGTSREVLYLWTEAHPSFLNAKRSGQDASLLWWERLGRAGAAGQVEKFSPPTWIFVQKCRFGMRDGSEVSKQKGPESEAQVISEAAANLEAMLNARKPK